MLEMESIRNELLRHLNKQPTQDQFRFIKKLSNFLSSSNRETMFVLRGYAGTGKTTLVKSITQSLKLVNMRPMLMAPTGRAAKVMARYTGRRAHTIHRIIYRRKNTAGGGMRFSLAHNSSECVLYIVDEASMIGGETQSGPFGVNNLLEDVLSFVNDGVACKVLFIGDVAQLPPVGMKLSKALAPNYLNNTYGGQVDWIEMKEVVRQAKGSGILYNATHLRNLLLGQSTELAFNVDDYPDVDQITGVELEDELSSSYGKYGELGSIVLTRSNKRANLFNQQVRYRILQREDSLTGGDIMMVVKNNYFWLDKDHSAGFIANGDMFEVRRVQKIEDKYGFTFASVEIQLSDYPEDKPFEVKLLLNTIESEAASLPYSELERLFQNIAAADFPGEEERALRKKVAEHKYYNALQVKFAYAITCHKSQGGQWESVFVDQGYLTEEMIDVDWLRWLYTAITRATEQLYFVNFSPEFFED